MLGFVLIGLVTNIAGKVLMAGMAGERVGASHRAPFVEHTLSGDGPRKILVIPIMGIISDMEDRGFFTLAEGMVTQVRDMLHQARGDDDVRAVVLRIESPGGGITASDVIHHEITRFREETGKPVVAHLGDVAASGGYYVAASAERIVAHPTSLTGSIGVIMPLIGFEGLMEKIGVESRPIKSGELKDMGSMYRPVTQKEETMLQAMVDEYHQRFVSIVADGFQTRGRSESREQIERHCDGRIFSGETAAVLGFADELGYFEDAVAAARSMAALTAAETRVVTYRRQAGLLDVLLGQAQSKPSDTLTVRIEGVTNADRPRFLYLWTVGRPGIRAGAQ